MKSVLLLFCGFLFSLHSLCQNTAELTRGGVVSSERADDKSLLSLNYYALIIGTNKYKNPHWDSLPNPVGDAEKLEETLRVDYNFETTILRNPSKKEVLNKIRFLVLKSQKDTNQNILIFVAGHGGFDDVFSGYIVPTDGEDPKTDSLYDTFILHSMLRGMLEGFANKHFLLILDVCYGGTFDAKIARYRGTNTTKTDMSKELIQRKLKYRSKIYVTSGGKEYVRDGTPGKSSPFCSRLLTLLRESAFNQEPVTYKKLLAELESLAPEPRSGFFGDHEEGGDFIFIPRKY
jgi:hypothetical protein